MDRTGARLAAIAVLSAAYACAGDPPGGGDAGVAPAASPFRSALIGEPSPHPESFRLALTEPGAEPRRQLHYRVASGSRERVKFSVTNTAEVLVSGRRVNKMTPPTTEVGFELEAEARPGGGYRCTAWITEASSTDWERMAPGRGLELKESLAQLNGHHFAFEVDARGAPLSQSITVPDKLEKNRDESLRILKSVDASVIPFPLEPVGVGAIWTVADVEPGRSNLAGPITLTYTLVAMRGDRVELTRTLALPPEPAPLSLGGTEVTGYSSGVTEGSMRVTVDLHRLLAVEIEGEIKSEVEGRTFFGSEVLPFKAMNSTRQRLQSR